MHHGQISYNYEAQLEFVYLKHGCKASEKKNSSLIEFSYKILRYTSGIYLRHADFQWTKSLRAHESWDCICSTHLYLAQNSSY